MIVGTAAGGNTIAQMLARMAQGGYMGLDLPKVPDKQDKEAIEQLMRKRGKKK